MELLHLLVSGWTDTMGIKQYTVNVFDGGFTEWYLNGKIHREGGPAVEGTAVGGGKFWYWFKEGHLHREDGPAIEYSNGTKVWYLKGVRYDTEKEFQLALNPPKEYTKEELERLLGHPFKIV